MKLRLLPLLAAALCAAPALAQTTVKKVVLQGFWWDYTNNSYRNHWADYLADLAPRLKGLGIDAVWIPPAAKANGGTNSVGYGPFDVYDLGDKYQKGTTRTRVGTKDELLRLVAVLHANGIEVIEDVVLNHVDGAGTANGTGGYDPNAYSQSANGGYKNFRYACWATPLPETADNAAAYLARAGRWPKNFANFHAHAGHNTTTGDYAVPYFGPDFCYGDDGGTNGYGLSTNATFNPPQANDYSRTQGRQYLQWLKKQTGCDGIRWDAVKNYGYAPQQDWLYNVKYLTGFANGGETMLSTGEFVGSKTELDSYCQAVNSRNGGSEFAMGTFDFSLRGAIYNMVAGGGSYDLSIIPGAQQNQRVAYYAGSNTYVHRTAPFVNSHDTFRPLKNAAGNYTGWDTANELGAHIEPNDVRLSAAYAINLAVDGNPHIFFEDLFSLGYLGNRYAHLPTDATALPERSDIANLIWCHQHLNFKAGAYYVPWQSADHLVIERGGRALIGINDNFTTWQTATVATHFAPGTVLEDYSGANGTATATVAANQTVTVRTPPCNGSAPLGRRGYAVWAPAGQTASVYNPGRAVRTTQEWELADDLGDHNCRSLGQGGKLPDNSRTTRIAGKIFAAAGQPVAYTLYPEDNTANTRALVVGLFNQAGDEVSRATGLTTISGSYTPTASQWLTLKVGNATATQTGQRAYVQATYQAPAVASTLLPANATDPAVVVWNAGAGTADALDCRNYEGGRAPADNVTVRVPGTASPQPVLSAGGRFVAGRLLLDAGSSFTVQRRATVQLFGDLTNNGTLAGDGTWVLTGLARTPQRLEGSGPLTFSKLEIRNDSADVALGANLTVRDTLTLTKARLVLGSHDVNLGTANVLSASGASYVLMPSAPGLGGLCQRVLVTGASGLFPVGTASGYAPLTLSPAAGLSVGVRTFDGVLFTNGTAGPAPATFVNRTWVSICTNGTANVSATAQWNAADENASFQRFQSAAYHGGSPAQLLSPAAVPASGSGPYRATFANLPVGVALTVGNFGPLAARASAGPALLALAPNPTAGAVALHNLSGATRLTLALRSVLGQELLPPTAGTPAAVEARLNAVLGTAAAGVYVVTVQANNQTQHLRLVRE